jgi:hypothetical protein
MNFCHHCFSNATFIGEFFEGHDLVFHEGFYKVVVPNGHTELFRFDKPPVKDICAGLTEEEEEKVCAERWEEVDALLNYAEEFRQTFRFDPQTGEEICRLARALGWVPDNFGWIEYWIIERAAVLIQQHAST